MSDAKPLSKERRAEILEAMDMDEYGDAVGLPMIRDILAAEAFWREAFDSLSHCAIDDFSGRCRVCDRREGHAATCAILANQD